MDRSHSERMPPSRSVCCCCDCPKAWSPLLLHLNAYHGRPNGTSSSANRYWNAESVTSAGESAPDPGAMVGKEAGTRPVVRFESETTYNGVYSATARDCDASDVVSMDCAKKVLQPVPSKASPTTLVKGHEFWSTLPLYLVLIFIIPLGLLALTISRLFATQADGHKRYKDIKPENISHLNYGKCEHPLGVAERELCREKGRLHLGDPETLSSELKIPHSRCGSYRTHWTQCTSHRHRQHASNQYQYAGAAFYRGLRRLHLSDIAFKGSSWRNNKRHQHKTILIPLVLVTYPSSASAALPSMASEVFHQHVPHVITFVGTEIKDPVSLTSSTAQNFLVWGVFTCAAGGLLILQRSNPHLKYFGFLANGFLMTVCVAVGTETMLKLFPWTVMGTLLISSLFYVFSSSICGSADYTPLKTSDSCEKGPDR